MKTSMKKIFTMLMALVLALSVMDYSALAVQASEASTKYYTFNDVTAYDGYGYTAEVSDAGVVDLSFASQWQEVRYTLPNGVDGSSLESISFNVSEGDVASLCIKIYVNGDHNAAVQEAYETNTIDITTDLSAAEKVTFALMNNATTAADYVIDNFTIKAAQTGGSAEVPGVDSTDVATTKYYTFNDLTEKEKYGCTPNVSSVGAMDLSFEGKWQEIKYKLPEGVDGNNLKSIILDITEGDLSNLAIKVYADGEQVAVSYESNTINVVADLSGATEVTFGLMNRNDVVADFHINYIKIKAIQTGGSATAPIFFEDLLDDAYYVEPVMWAVENGITNGLTPTSFGPDGVCSRGQVVTFLWRANGSPEPSSLESQFTDVQDTSAYYYKPVLWAVEAGITTGLTDTTFGPDEPCTRGQVVTFMWRTVDKPSSDSSNPFTDLDTNAYYFEPVLWAVENGITTGLTTTTFGPDATCSRGQIVTFLYRGFAEEEEVTYSTTTVFGQGIEAGDWTRAISIGYSQFEGLAFDGAEKIIITYKSTAGYTQFQYCDGWWNTIKPYYDVAVSETYITEEVVLTSDYSNLSSRGMVIQGSNWAVEKVELSTANGTKTIYGAGQDCTSWEFAATVSAGTFSDVTFDGTSKMVVTYKSLDPSKNTQFQYVSTETNNWLNIKECFDLDPASEYTTETIELTEAYAEIANVGFGVQGTNWSILKIDLVVPDNN